MFSTRIFVVEGLTFKYLIHFDIVFVSGIKQGSSFILSHVGIQFFSAPFIEETNMFLVPLLKIN